MLSARCLVPPLAALLLALTPACTNGGAPQIPDDGGARDVSAMADVSALCDPADDPDRDGISSRIEGTGDSDNDGVADARDPDSDDDGVPDAIEAGGGRRYVCSSPPTDSDSDGTPDFRDTDSNGDTIPDAMQAAPSPAQPATAQPPRRDCLVDERPGVRVSAVTAWTCHPFDTDRDGVADIFDADVDNDGILNPLEVAPGDATAPTDTDRDGVPDYRDGDSDGDTVLDRHEGSDDRDGDGAPNFRDLDSDGDASDDASSTRLTDRGEAGDEDPETPPRECPNELDVRTFDPRSRVRDGVPDLFDVDADNDGLGDAEELLAGTNACNPDTDNDGQLDSIEVAWCRVTQRAHCATDRGLTAPASEVWALLPYNGAAVTREAEFSASLRAVDLFFLIETSPRTEAFRAALTSALGATPSAAIEGLRALVPDLRVGLGRFEDFDAPMPGGGRYGAVNDRPFWPLCAGPPGTVGCGTGWGIQMQPLARIGDVLSTALAFTSGAPGGDTPGSQVEALYQSITGAGLFTGPAASVCAGYPGRSPCWVAPRDCADDTRGAPCFRREALPVVALATATDFHEGPAERAGAVPWSPYAGFAPPSHTFDEALGAFTRAGGRAIGFNLHPSARCDAARTMRVPGEPCFDLMALSRGTRTLDRAGAPLVYDLATTSPTPASVSEALIAATQTLSRSVPFNVTLSVRGDPMNGTAVDVTRFVTARLPSCQIAGAPPDRCWTPPPGVPMAAAVSRTDMNGFYAVVPGTRVRFTFTLRNQALIEADLGAMRVLRLLVDVLGDGAVLDTRLVNIVVPAAQRL